MVRRRIFYPTFKFYLTYRKCYGHKGIIDSKQTEKNIFCILVSITASCSGTSDSLVHTINSPNYPSNYGDNANCNWRIVGPTGTQLRLHFNDFTTESNVDKLSVYDGASSNSNEILSVSGPSVPNDITSTSNNLYVTFETDGNVVKRGFKITYSTTGNVKIL